MSAGLLARVRKLESALSPGVRQLGDSDLRRIIIESLGSRWPAIERQISQCAELGVEWCPVPDDGDLTDLIGFVDEEIRRASKELEIARGASGRVTSGA